MNSMFLTPRTIPLVFELSFHRLAIFVHRVVRMLAIRAAQTYEIVGKFSLSHKFDFATIQ